MGLRRQYPLPREWGGDYVNDRNKNRQRIKLQRDAVRCEYQTAIRTDLTDMLSTPTATPSDISPARMLCAIFLIAMSPEEQSRLMVETGTLSGIPAASAAARETYKGEGGWQVPSQFVPRYIRKRFEKSWSTYPYLRRYHQSTTDSI